MHSSLGVFRYFVFGVFLVCNAIILTVAVWNLNLLQEALFPSSSSPLRTDAYLAFVGCAGLALIFPIAFCELAQKSIFLVSVWFECIWVALFCIMELAGATAASAVGADELCQKGLLWIAIPVDRSAICASSRVLQAFSWICGLTLLSYFVLFFMTTLLRRRDDDTVWKCDASRFPWVSARHKLDTPSSPLRDYVQEKPTSTSSHRKWGSRSGRSGKFTIAAPRPFNAAANAVRKAILSYRSGKSVDLTSENNVQPAETGGAEGWRHSTFRFSQGPLVDQEWPDIERPLPPAPLPLAPQPPTMVTRQATSVTFGNSFYPQHMQGVLAAAPAQQERVRVAAPTHAVPRQPPSPSPIGNWPRMNPAIPERKRKSNALPPLVAAQVEQTRHQRLQSLPPLQIDAARPPRPERQLTFPPVQGQTLPSRFSRPLPNVAFEQASSPSIPAPPAKVAPHPPHHQLTSPSRPRPSGPWHLPLEENQTPTRIPHSSRTFSRSS